MSVKRQATTELNHENWDQEDEVDQEEGTGFKMASKEVLEKRVIRTAKRRNQVSSDEAKKTVFSAFSGFNKTQKSSFDFLANLTNGNKANNNNTTITTESETTPGFNNTKLTTSPTIGGFGLTGTSTPLTKFTFGIQKSESESLFSGATTPAFSQSTFTSKVAAAENPNPFQIQTSQNSNVNSDKSVVSQGFGSVATSVFSKSLFTPKLGTSENSSNNKNESTQSAKLTTDLIYTPSSNTSKPVVSQGFGGVAFSQSMLTSKPEATGNSTPFKMQSPQNSSFKIDSVSAHSGNVDKPDVSQVFGGNTNSPFTKSLFSSKPNMSGNLVPTDKPVVSGFGVVTTNAFSQSMFSAKLDTSGNSSPFKIQSTQSSTLTNSSANSDNSIASQGSTGLFGISPSGNNASTLFAKSGNTSTPFKTQDNITNSVTIESDLSVNKVNNEKARLIYFNRLENLNKSVLAWIQKHVEETPLCYLIPVFVDYEKHLKRIYGDYTKSIETNEDSVVEAPTSLNPKTESNLTKTSTNSSSTSDKTENSSVNQNTTSTFGGGTASGGFSFGIKYPMGNSTPNNNNLPTSSVSKTPFSFGTGKPFSFNSNVKKPEESVKESEENDDAPPKVEYTPIVEENSVFDKKCKVFVKKDGNFVDKGVGTLYIKKIEESGKYQLLVRANTALGNVLLNFVLSSAITTQRMGKNNVMMVCIPTPDAKPPPTPILIRVKTSEEADQLLETLNKYKA